MKIFITSICLLAFLTSFSQNCNWAQRQGSTTADYGQDITSDQEGNTYSVGYLNGSMVTGCSTLTSAGSTDMYVQKRDRHGNCIWAFSKGSTGIDAAYGVAYDTAGFIYVTGAFQGTITFPSYTITANAGAGDIFLAKYDTDGNNVWAKNLGGSSETFAADYGNRVTVDKNGNVLVTSLVLSGGPPFTMGCTTFPIPAAWIVAVSKYDKNGICQWNKLIRNNNQMFVGDITSDPAGNVFVLFTSYGTLTYFDCDTISASGNVTPQIAKYDPNGNCLWAKNLGTADAPVEGRGYGIESDTSGNIYLTGGISGPVNISCEAVTTTNPAEIFINKRDNNGNCIWSKKAGGASADQGLHIVRRDSALYVAGSFAGTCTFPTDVLTGVGIYQSGFIARWDLNGNFKWANEAGQGSQICELYGVAADKYGSAYVTGYALANPIAFQCTTLNSLGSYDATFARYAPPCLDPTAQFVADTVCLGGATSFTNTSLYGSDPFDSFGWDFTGDSVVDVTTVSPTYVFSTAGTHTVMLIAENDCGGIDTLFKQILVHALPVVSVTLNPASVCVSVPTYSLTGGSPAGGTYSGTGVSAGNFNPALAGAGTHTITYTFTNANGCTAASSHTVTVLSLPNVSAGADETICAGNTTTLTATGGISYSWSTGATSTSIMVSPTALASYTVAGTDVNSCSKSDVVTLFVNAIPSVSVTLNPDTVCSTAATYSLTGGTPSGGTFSGTGVSAGTFNPGLAGVGTHTVLYTYTDGNGCSSADTANIVVQLCTGILEYVTGPVRIYPNPFIDNIQIENKSGSSVRIKITGIDGKELSSINSSLSVIRIDLSELSQGMYFVYMTDARSGRLIGSDKIIK